jgi:branched-chain amino acid transport system substrate-binding protein
LEEIYTPGERDYSQLVEKLQAADIEVIYVGGYTVETGLMVRQARDRDYTAQFVSGDALTNEEFWLITGQAGEGTLGTFGPDPRTYEAAASVVARFRDKGFEPSGYTLHTYAAVQSWAQATQKAGSLAVDKVIEALRHEQFDTVLGEISFNDKGDVTAPGYIWYMWKNGKYIPVP